MKKILFALIGLIVVCPTAFAAPQCKSNNVTISYVGNQEPDDDEFLYMNKNEYDTSVSGYESSGHFNSGYGHGFECDQMNSANCQCDTVIEMPAGHVFGGQVIKEKRKYQCSCGFNDKWVVVDDGICHTKFGDIPVGQHAMQNGVMRVLSKTDCSGIPLTSDLGTEFEGVCRDEAKFVCKAKKCVEGYKADNGGVCIVDKSGKQDNNASEKGLDCTNSGGKWNGTSCVCDSGKHIKLDSSKTACECESGYDWKSDHKQGCYKKQAPVVPNPEPKKKCENSWGRYENSKCVCDSELNLIESNGECVCKDASYERDNDSKSCKRKSGGDLVIVSPDQKACNEQPATIAYWENGECVCKQSGYEWNGTDCQKSAAIINAEIDTVYADIQNLESRYATKISKWKDAEGNFNTARLASDSIAGVVLGTVGGVVTSTIIKKNQIEDGFEDLKCSIGGQSVATWGDEFQVGLQ